MQEFTTVSASSYDPAALATKLTEKASEGWSVAGIVSTGGDVTAFLSRDKSSSTGASSAAAAAAGSSGSSSPATSTSDRYGGGTSGTALTGAGVSGSSGSSGNEYGASSSSSPGSTSSYTTPSSSDPPRVTEPAGWGSVPASSSAGTSSSGSSSGGMAPIGEQQSSAPAAGVYNPAPAAPAVPAGWYADPAGRFELRYWDGTTWTEHVSRAGQQYTDPPVA